MLKEYFFRLVSFIYIRSTRCIYWTTNTLLVRLVCWKEKKTSFFVHSFSSKILYFMEFKVVHLPSSPPPPSSPPAEPPAENKISFIIINLLNVYRESVFPRSFVEEVCRQNSKSNWWLQCILDVICRNVIQHWNDICDKRGFLIFLNCGRVLNKDCITKSVLWHKMSKACNAFRRVVIPLKKKFIDTEQTFQRK